MKSTSDQESFLNECLMKNAQRLDEAQSETMKLRVENEATCPMINAITHAKMEGRLIWYFSQTSQLPSTPSPNIENSLRFMEFTDNFIWAFMKLVANWTLHVEVNNSKSADYRIVYGTGQGDRKSSYTFDCSVAPLNHLIANSPIIYTPFKPVFFADDNLIPLQRDRPQEIL